MTEQFLFPFEVAALFCMSPAPRRAPQWESPYRALPSVDVWDRERDATKYKGPSPVVAHPPCRAWGKLQHFAKPREGERALALYALACVHRWGGVLEHPEGSELWSFAGVSKNERMHTPPALAEWLVSIARRCSV